MEHKQRGRSWRIALGLSVIFNLFFIAIIGGHIWRNRIVDVGGKAPFAVVLAHAEAGLTPEDAKAFDAAIRQGAPQYVEAARRLRRARLAVRDQVMAESFDSQKAQAALADWQTAWNAFMNAFDPSLIEALSKVTPDGRRQLVAQRHVGALSP